MVICIFCFLLFLKLFRPGGFRIDMLDVGQGDGIYIESEEGVSFFIDGGSSSESEIGKYTILPFLKSQGVSRIDYWLLTHLDMDHVNGFMEVLESGYQVKNVCMAKATARDEVFYKIEKLCKSSGTELVLLDKNDRISTDSMSFEVLYPGYPSSYSGANENSLIMFLDLPEWVIN